MRLRPGTVAHTLFLAAVGALPSLAIDMGLPALGAIGRSLGVGPAAAALTLSLFMVGFGVGPLLAGPLSDRVGRRPLLLCGLLLFAAGGLLAALSGGLDTLLAARVLQGLGGGTGATLAFAVIRDLHDGRAAQRRIANVGAVSTTAPMVAPTLGAALLGMSGWRAIYLVPAAGAMLLLLLAVVAVEETLPAGRRAAGRALPLLGADLRFLARTPGFVLGCAVNACSFAALFAYVSGSPLVCIGLLGMHRAGFAALFAGTSCCIIAGVVCNGRLAGRLPVPERMLGLAVAVVLLVDLLLLGLSLLHALTLVRLVPLLLLANLFFGLGAPGAAHAALQPAKRQAGTASGLLTTAQMACGAASSGLVSWWFAQAGVLAMTGVMAGFACVSAACCLGLRAWGAHELANRSQLG